MRNPFGSIISSSDASIHLIRFTAYNVIGAMIPLLLAAIIRRMGRVGEPPGAYSQELLFFAVMVSATSLGDLTDERELSDRPVFHVMKNILIVCCIVVAGLFGIYEYDVIIGSSNKFIGESLNSAAVWAAVCMLITCMLVQLQIAQIRAAKNASNG